VQLHVEDGHTISSISEESGISVGMLSRWVRKYQAMGQSAFDSERGTRRHRKEIHPAIQDTILTFKDSNPKFGLRRIVDTARYFFHLPVGIRAVRTMPLNSPPAYPKYNGAEERGQGELKMELKRHLAGVEGWTLNTIAPFAQAAANDLNHMNLKVLNGSYACHIHATTRITFTLNERKKIYGWIMKRRDIILESGGKSVTPESTWRIAAVQWLLKNELIKISAAKKCHPVFRPKNDHQFET
jgi:ribosomal protein L31